MVAGHAGEDADDGDLSGGADGVHGTGERFAAANFENDVDTLAAGEAQHFLVPLGMRLIVDGLVRAERFGSRQLFIAAGCYDHARAVQFGELETEDGHAAGAEEQDCIAGLHVRGWHQRVPGGEAGARKRGGFLKTQVLRNAEQSFLMEDAILGENAVNSAPQRRCAVLASKRAGDPVLKKRSHNAVARVEGTNAIADSDHFAEPSEAMMVGCDVLRG